MKRRIHKRPQALRDIEESFVYIGEDDLDAAMRFLDAVEQSTLQLSEHPYLGSNCGIENPQITHARIWPVKGFEKFLIFYFAGDDSIELIRVLHTARDLHRIFDDTE